MKNKKYIHTKARNKYCLGPDNIGGEGRGVLFSQDSKGDLLFVFIFKAGGVATSIVEFLASDMARCYL